MPAHPWRSLIVVATLSASAVAEPINLHPIGSTASGVYGNNLPYKAFDGNTSTEWNSGGNAPATITADLGYPTTVNKIRMLPDMWPWPGTVRVQIYVGVDPNVNNQRLAIDTTFNNVTGLDWLEAKANINTTDHLGNVRYVTVKTVANPNWVAWKEIEIDGGVEYFGYFRDYENPQSDYISETTGIGGANLTWIAAQNPTNLSTGLTSTQSHPGTKAIVDLQGFLWPTQNWSDPPDESQWLTARDAIITGGFQNIVAAFFIVDEPDKIGASGISKAHLDAAVDFINRDFPGIPTAVNVADAPALWDPTQMRIHDYTYLSRVEWISYDCYYHWFGTGTVCPNSGKIIPELNSIIKSWVTTNNINRLNDPTCQSSSPPLPPQCRPQRLMAVPHAGGGVSPEHPSGPLSPDFQDSVIEYNINPWQAEVLSDSRYVAVISFLWHSVEGPDEFWGARDNLSIGKRTHEFGRYFIPSPSDTHVYPVAYAASNTGNGWYLFDAFDGDDSTVWNAGGWPSQWIVAYLGGIPSSWDSGANSPPYAPLSPAISSPALTHVTQIQATINLWPTPAQATVYLDALGASGWTTLTSHSGSTADGQIALSWLGSSDFSEIRVRTTAGDDWVSWREIRIWK